MSDVISLAEADTTRTTITNALKEIRSLRAELAGRPPARTEITVTSAACRLPGAVTPEAFWDLLNAGNATTAPIPADRWDNDAVFSPHPGSPGRSYVTDGSFIENPFAFDPEPFRMSPREAASTDPHHRLILMCTWEALERAGIAPDSLRGSRTGVFVGMSGNDFERSRLAGGANIDGLASLGSAANFAANRVSYALGLHGPSLVLDTACSSSLVALHQARHALNEGECDLAIVAGVNVMLSAEAMIALSQSRMLSPTGRCHTFSDQADGYARGEGCVVVVLRRAADQPADAVPPLGTLLGTAVNQDGPTSGITVPNGSAQADLIRCALKDAGIAPTDVDYVEAHGTGTPLGDPIELRALATVHAGRTSNLPVGSSKPITGHLEGAAGLVGFLKALLVVAHGTIPAQPVDGTLTRGVDWNALPLTVPTETFTISASNPVAGVSSFGYGGTNAHAIVRRSGAAPLSEAVPVHSTYPWKLANLRPSQGTRSVAAAQMSGLHLRVLRTGHASAEGRTRLNARSVPLLTEHIVHGQLVVPGVVFMELVLRLAEAAIGAEARVVALDISRPCVIADDETLSLVVAWQESTDLVVSGTHTITVSSMRDDGMLRHAIASLTTEPVTAPLMSGVADAKDAGVSIDHETFYGELWPNEFHIGRSLTLVDSAHRLSDGELRGRIAAPPIGCAALTSGIRPALLVLDAAVQVAGALRHDRADGIVTLGTGFAELTMGNGIDFTDGAEVHAIATSEGRADLIVSSPGGPTRAMIVGVTNLPVTAEQLTAALGTRSRSSVELDIDGVEDPKVLARRAVAASLGIDEAVVDGRARLEDLMDSILLVELAETLTPHAKRELAVSDLLEAETVDGLASWLQELGAYSKSRGPVPAVPVASTASPSGSAAHLPLRKRELTVETMTALAAEYDLPGVTSTPRDALPDGILLTGATGFVGSFLLRELLATTDRPIFCLVRADDQAQAKMRLRTAAAAHGLRVDGFDERVTAIVGDLAQERFGLDTSAYQDLHEHVGDVFHNAGAVKWTASYDQLAPHNVAGTAEVLKFASKGNARPVHFTSTVGVFSSDRIDLGTIDETVPLTDSDALVVGYAQTKWVSEMMIRRAGALGLPFTIHRINSGPSTTSAGFNRLDHLSLIVKGCIESGLAPLDGPFPVQAAPIDHIARAYVRLALDPDFEGSTSHLVGEAIMPWSDFFAHVERYGYPVTRLPFEEWRAAVTNRRSGTLALLGLAPFLTRTIDDVHLADFCAPLTRAALGADGPWCPVLDQQLVHTFLDGFVAGRFINPPTA
ncbi:thioester reductase-like protein [Arthrobacter pigmenti]|uniref:Thioester reductase-like protein n=1 Tax=Arthrobacter pigmenti TaxID=271432 RepID=A0A846RM33_9MICC|nr:thioester reductase domain-containing protein [Arthrobacter pigmenti]NJC22169.1 thioester reductase-like protein [Arthrobacter pigmenti]